jgi:hypothetical protein
MKIAFSTISCPAYTAEQMCRAARDYGYDAAAGEDRWSFVLLGEGELAPHVRQAIALLARRGFDGYVSVDWEKQWHPEIADPEVALPHFAERLRRYVAAAEAPASLGR